MTDKDKIIKELKEALDSLDITNKYRLNLIRAIEYLQEEPVSPCVECASISEGCKEICYGYNKWVRDNHKEEPVSKDLK